MDRSVHVKPEIVCGLMSQVNIERFWPQMVHELNRVPHIWNKWWTLEALRGQALGGGIQMWGVSHGRSIQMVVCSVLVDFPAGRALQVFLAFGNSMDESLPTVVATLENFALSMDCKRVEVVGREGWEKVLARHGLKYEHSTLSIDLSKRSVH